MATARSRSIYFFAAIHDGSDVELYRKMVTKMSKYGRVLSAYLANEPEGAEAGNRDNLVHDRDIAWMTEADVVVAEITYSSIAVGYELGRAVGMGKRILGLYRPRPDKKLSSIINGIPMTQAFIFDYRESDLDEMFLKFFR